MSLYKSKYDGPQIDAMIANGGSPSGTYANLSDLTAAIPAGNTKIYVTLDNGKWCYWSGTAWEAGGTYIGTAATFAIGTVAKGDNAAVTNSGTNNAIVLDFVLPKGDKGEDGVMGVDGAPGPQGPQGIQGEKGDKGDAAATVNVGTTTTGAAGSSASVTNSGTSSDAVFNFVIPQGTTGAIGAKGDNGRGIASVVRTSGTGAPGTTDTYTITFTDNTTTTFGVYNGADGSGAGDMVKATYDTNNSGVVDNAEKVNGLTVLTAVPSGAVFTDTIYTHPANHPPSIIAQDASNRFVTDTEKAEWNGKANPPTAVTATLSTTWAGSGPYTQSVTVSGVTSTNNITVSLASTADEAQRNAARDALLSATAQATNSITVAADGDKPMVALPIQVLILGG